MISAPHVLLLVAAGVVAGVVGTAGGIATLVSYPALLLAGVSPLPADVVNMVALLACWPGAALASQPELKGRSRWLGRYGIVTAAGGALGAGLLTTTSSAAFARVVPFLVALGSLALLAQPWLSRLTGDRARGSRPPLVGGLFVVSVYNGYFGAGAGVMTLGLLLFSVDEHVARANALKNMLVGAAVAAAAIVLIAVVPVIWSATVPLACGMFAGASVGPRVARRIPGGWLRWLVAVVGIGLAVKLWVAPG